MLQNSGALFHNVYVEGRAMCTSWRRIEGCGAVLLLISCVLSLLIRAYARMQIFSSSVCRCRCSAGGAPMCSCTSWCILSGLLCSCVLIHVIRAALQLLVQPSMPCKARVRVTQRQSINHFRKTSHVLPTGFGTRQETSRCKQEEFMPGCRDSVGPWAPRPLLCPCAP